MASDRLAAVIAALCVLAALFLMWGCTPTVKVECPSIRAYSAEFQGQAADQLEGIPEGSPIDVMIRDYGELRAASRACAGR